MGRRGETRNFSLSHLYVSLCPTCDVNLFRLLFLYLPRWLSGNESACQCRNTGDMGSIPGLGRSLGEGDSSPLQYSCLENSTDRGAWWATLHGVAHSQIQPSAHTCPTTLFFFFKVICKSAPCCSKIRFSTAMPHQDVGSEV